MKKACARFKRRLYSNLEGKLEALLPEQVNPRILVVPYEKDTDFVTVTFTIPHKVTRKLMWYFKVWR